MSERQKQIDEFVSLVLLSQFEVRTVIALLEMTDRDAEEIVLALDYDRFEMGPGQRVKYTNQQGVEDRVALAKEAIPSLEKTMSSDDLSGLNGWRWLDDERQKMGKIRKEFPSLGEDVYARMKEYMAEVHPPLLAERDLQGPMQRSDWGIE